MNPTIFTFLVTVHTATSFYLYEEDYNNNHYWPMEGEAGGRVINQPSIPNNNVEFKVGRCNIREYYQQTQECTTMFYTTVRMGKISNFKQECSTTYGVLKVCIENVLKQCIQDTPLTVGLSTEGLWSTVIDNVHQLLGDEERWCTNGGLDSQKFLHQGVTCDPLYEEIAQECTKTYHELFSQGHSSLNDLCKEYNKAKVCLVKHTLSHCTSKSDLDNELTNMLVDTELDFQPFCSKRAVQKVDRHKQLKTKKCRSATDVLILADVSEATTDEDFQSMKETAKSLVNDLTYGTSGINVGFVQYAETVEENISLDKFITEEDILKALDATTRSTEISSGSKRNTGAALKYAAEHITKKSNPQRPSLVIILSSGKSDDEIDKESLRQLWHRGATTVAVGPHLTGQDIYTYDHIFQLHSTIKFEDYTQRIIDVICESTEQRNEPDYDAYYYDYNLQHAPVDETDVKMDNLLQHFITHERAVHLPLLHKPVAPESEGRGFESHPQQRDNSSNNMFRLYEG